MLSFFLAVRYGRVPKKSKEKERLGLEEKANGITQAEADQSSTSEQDQPMVDEAKDLALYDTILTISQAHHANCSYTDDKIKGLAKKPIYVVCLPLLSFSCLIVCPVISNVQVKRRLLLSRHRLGLGIAGAEEDRTMGASVGAHHALHPASGGVRQTYPRFL